MRATRAVIHLENLRSNIRTLRGITGGDVRICMAVKADGYGHGAAEISRTAEDEGIDCFGVASAEEGIELRESGITGEILVYGLVSPGEYPALFEYRLVPFAADRKSIDELNALAGERNTRLKIHLKIDTGMGRIGCTPEEAPELAVRTAESENLLLAGTGTHFASADSADTSFTEKQIRKFNRAVREIRNRGIDPGTLHAANSGAVLGHPESLYGMVRPGIMLYGYYPSHEQPRSFKLTPVMELKTRIVFLKRVPAGTPVSYGSVYRAPEDTVIATLPIGYADGLNRGLSNNLTVTVRGRGYPLAGRICMDQCMVDLGPSPEAGLYDEVTLFGPPPAVSDAETLAETIGTIPYEVTCAVGKRVPREFIDS